MTNPIRPRIAWLACLCVLGTAAWSPPSRAEEPRPDWISDEKLALIERIGIDPAADLAVKGNYHWKWRAHRELAIAGYRCPSGSEVMVSRSIVLVHAFDRPCTGPDREPVTDLKIYPDGTAEPIGQQP